MPDIAFTYEMDGKLSVRVFGQGYAIPGPDNPADPCPFCGPALPDSASRLMRKGYYLSVSWIDYLTGQIIGELEALGHKDDTVIALVGDHGVNPDFSVRLANLASLVRQLTGRRSPGWQLGEHNIWGKHTNFELGVNPDFGVTLANIASLVRQLTRSACEP